MNGIIGVGTIWVLTVLGVQHLIANLLGYGVALAAGFMTAKRFVFRSGGNITPEAARYLSSFLVCYLVNLGTLFVCVSWLDIPAAWAQGLAILSYVVSMYLLSRIYVFAGRSHDGG